MKLRLSLILLSLVTCHLSPVFADETISFSPESRVLIVSPHPDDESLGTAGVIQSAVRAQAAVKVVYLTHGDDNELSSLFYLKKPLLIKSDFIRSGQIRKEEAVGATSVLGLHPKDLIFLGYPDSGTMRIWRRHWGNAKPFRSFLTRIDKVPYKGDFSYDTPYKGENILRDFETVIREFDPTHVFVTAPLDSHPDHQAAYLYVNLALLELEGQIIRPRVFSYLVHAPRGLSPFSWIRHPLTEEEARAKEKAIRKYHSQMAYGKNFLLSFVRTDELFLELPELRVGREDKFAENQAISYRIAENKEFWIRARLKDPLDETGGLGLEIFSYKNGVPFSVMPKLSLWLFGNRLFVSDGRKKLNASSVSCELKENEILMRVPLELLKDPDLLFVALHAARQELSPDLSAWKILRLSEGKEPE